MIIEQKTINIDKEEEKKKPKYLNKIKEISLAVK